MILLPYGDVSFLDKSLAVPLGWQMTIVIAQVRMPRLAHSKARHASEYSVFVLCSAFARP